MKLSILKKTAKIHAAKCNKATDESVAIKSYVKLQDITKRLENATEEEIIVLNTEIETWKNTSPIVTEREINDLIKRR